MVANGYKPTIISLRQEIVNLTNDLIQDIPAVAWIIDDLVMSAGYSVPVRIYHPRPEEKRPVIVFYHGGGHATGSVSVYDPICRKLAATTGQIIVSVEYRLAPENPYPAGLTDAYKAARQVFVVLDQRKLLYKKVLSLAGDSAGGGLAASVSARAQFDHSLNIANQILIYPSLDYTMSLASVEENGRGCFLTKGCTAWYFDNYFQNGENRYEASPLYGTISSRLPRTLVVSSGCDPLRDEAIAYLSRLQNAGVPCQHLHFDDMIHGFLNMEDLIKDECAKVYQTIAQFLNEGAGTPE